MGKELRAYRDNVERIKAVFPTKEMLSIGEVVQFTGLSRSTVTKMFPFKDRYISVAVLARRMSEE